MQSMAEFIKLNSVCQERISNLKYFRTINAKAAVEPVEPFLTLYVLIN